MPMPKEAPRRACFMKVAETATLIEREDIVNSLRNWIRDSRILITDMKFLRQSMEVAVYVLDLFNNIGMYSAPSSFLSPPRSVLDIS